MGKKRNLINQRIQNVGHESFTPLVMTANCGFGRECKHFYAKLSGKIADKKRRTLHLSCVLGKTKDHVFTN